MKKSIFLLFVILLVVLFASSCDYVDFLDGITSAHTTAAETTIAEITEPAASAPVTEKKTSVKVMIDAGHGEIDPGAIGYYNSEQYKEKDINLSVALLLKEELCLRGYTVFMIREDDSSLLHGKNNIEEIKKRIELAVSLDSDVYISLHCNSYSGNARAYGPIIFYNGSADYKAEEFSEILKSEVIEGMSLFPDTRECRIRRDDEYAVLRSKSMPTFLFEMGFITDESDIRQLQDPTWQRALAISIANGIDALNDKKYID